MKRSEGGASLKMRPGGQCHCPTSSLVSPLELWPQGGSECPALCPVFKGSGRVWSMLFIPCS